MVAERDAEAGVVVEQRRVEEAEIRQHGIQADGGVALAEDEAVAVGPARLGRVETQMRVVQRGEQLGRRERAGVVAGAGAAAEPDRLLADEPGAVLEEAAADVAAAPLAFREIGSASWWARVGSNG